jgi:hypothetical protein
MNIREDSALLAIKLLFEGNSIRCTERITNLDRNTIMKVLNECWNLDLLAVISSQGIATRSK